jgi:hypothetical protein
MFDIVEITLDAAIDAFRCIGTLTVVVINVRPADNSRPNLAQVKGGKRFPWSSRK